MKTVIIAAVADVPNITSDVVHCATRVHLIARLCAAVIVWFARIVWEPVIIVHRDAVRPRQRCGDTVWKTERSVSEAVRVQLVIVRSAEEPFALQKRDFGGALDVCQVCAQLIALPEGLVDPEVDACLEVAKLTRTGIEFRPTRGTRTAREWRRAVPEIVLDCGWIWCSSELLAYVPSYKIRIYYWLLIKF